MNEMDQVGRMLLAEVQQELSKEGSKTKKQHDTKIDQLMFGIPNVGNKKLQTMEEVMEHETTLKMIL